MRFLDRSAMERETADTLAGLGVTIPDLRAASRNYSGGQRQALAFARAARALSRLLILDEPTAALGVEESANVVRTVQRLRRERGMAVLLITHNLDDMRVLADRVVVLAQGPQRWRSRTRGVDRRRSGRPHNGFHRRMSFGSSRTRIAVVGKTGWVEERIAVGPALLVRHRLWNEADKLVALSARAGAEAYAVHPLDKTSPDPDLWLLADAPRLALIASGLRARIASDLRLGRARLLRLGRDDRVAGGRARDRAAR